MTQRDTKTGLERSTRNNETERQEGRVRQRLKKAVVERDKKAELDRSTRKQ
jgi:hypothetical protein